MTMLVMAADNLDGNSVARALIKAFAQAFVLTWFVWITIAVIALAYIAYGVARRIVRSRRLARSGMLDIDRMPGKTFEQYLEVLFRRLGYKVERTRFVGDYGGDLVIAKGGVRTVVQAKRWTKTVGVQAVQEAVAAKGYYDCAEAMVVTNSHYSEQAAVLAHKNRVVLWDRQRLTKELAATNAKRSLHSEPAAVAPLSGAMPGPSDVGTPPEPALATVESCATCTKILTSGERSYCANNSRRFGGRMLCFRHQRTPRAPVA